MKKALKENNLDSIETVKKHKEIIQKKEALNKIYINFYEEFKKNVDLKNKDLLVELGSGGGFFKDFYPDALTSDVVKTSLIDKKFLAEKMPFKKDDVSYFYGLNVLHHVKDIEKALSEVERCLKKNGRAVFVEPANTIFSRLIYKYFHHEDFDPGSGWKINLEGRLSGANGALPWIVFVRDKEIFEKKYKNLKIANIRFHTPFSYLFSGGLSKPQLLPTSWILYIMVVEQRLGFLNNFIACFMTIVIEKR